jgi:hypothetical protein
LASQYVIGEENTRPVNLMLVCPSGGGGSALLLERYGQVEGVKAFGDITYMKLADTHLDRVSKGLEKTWIFAEFNKILSRKPSVSMNTVGLLDEVCEEGVPNISLPYFERSWNPPVKCNVIIKLTPSFLEAHALDWWSFGFLQRFSPSIATWTYSDNQIKTILLWIKNAQHRKEGIWSKTFKPRRIEVKKRYMDLIEERYTHEICNDMTNYIRNLCKKYRVYFNERLDKELPFRTQMRSQKLFEGLVLRNRNSVSQPEDWEDFEGMYEHINTKFEYL